MEKPVLCSLWRDAVRGQDEKFVAQWDYDLSEEKFLYHQNLAR